MIFSGLGLFSTCGGAVPVREARVGGAVAMAGTAGVAPPRIPKSRNFEEKKEEPPLVSGKKSDFLRGKKICRKLPLEGDLAGGP